MKFSSYFKTKLTGILIKLNKMSKDILKRRKTFKFKVDFDDQSIRESFLVLMK